MTNLFNELRTAITNRAKYQRTVNELRAMTQRTAIDLGLFKTDAEKTAASAIYG